MAVPSNAKPVSKHAAAFMEVCAPDRKNSAPLSEFGSPRPPRKVSEQTTPAVFRQIAWAFDEKPMRTFVSEVPSLLVPPLQKSLTDAWPLCTRHSRP